MGQLLTERDASTAAVSIFADFRVVRVPCAQIREAEMTESDGNSDWIARLE